MAFKALSVESMKVYEKYEYIAKVAELQSISKAAQELYITQPSLTRLIAGLEAELGISLFNRSKLPIQLTYAGERYLEEAKKILAIDKALRFEFQEMQELKKGSLTIGSSYAASTIWLPHILPQFKKEYPGININLIEKNSLDFEQALIKGSINLAFSSRDGLSTELDYEHISSVRILTFIPDGHPILVHKATKFNSIDNILSIDPTELNGQTFVLLGNKDGFGYAVEKMLRESNIQPANIIYTPNIVSCYRLAASGLGITFATPYATRYTIPGHVPVIAEIAGGPFYDHNVIAYTKERELSSIEKRFILLAKDIINNLPLLRPLNDSQWAKLKKFSKNSADYFDFA